MQSYAFGQQVNKVAGSLSKKKAKLEIMKMPNLIEEQRVEAAAMRQSLGEAEQLFNEHAEVICHRQDH